MKNIENIHTIKIFVTLFAVWFILTKYNPRNSIVVTINKIAATTVLILKIIARLVLCAVLVVSGVIYAVITFLIFRSLEPGQETPKERFKIQGGKD